MKTLILTVVLPALLFTTSCGVNTETDTSADRPESQVSQESQEPKESEEPEEPEEPKESEEPEEPEEREESEEPKKKAPDSSDSISFSTDQLVCPESPVPSRELTLVNFSNLPDEEVTNCFNFAVKNINPWEKDVMMVMYPVGPLLLPPGEVENNDTSFRGPGFTPVVSVEERNSMASSVEQFLSPICGPETAAFTSTEVSRFAELGGGQQSQQSFAPEGECAKKRLVVLSIDPDRAKPSEELVTTFFHEIFHAIQKPDPDQCTYSASQEDSFWIHEAGATYFALETLAELGGISSQSVWDKQMRFLSDRLEEGTIDRKLGDPAIAEKGAVALHLLAQRGELPVASLLDGSLFQGCNDSDAFSFENMERAKAYWSNYGETKGQIVFTAEALA